MRLTDADVRVAAEILERYRAGKAGLDNRISEEAVWWQSRHGGGVTAGNTRGGGAPVSAWLWGSVCNKHADLCDAIPDCEVLAREPEDEAEAAYLSAILPVIAGRCRFGQTYSDNAWRKIKHGVAAYGVFWNPLLETGIGDVDIRPVDVRSLYWEPGVRDIQSSPHLFLVGQEDSAALAAGYPAWRDGRAGLRADALLLAPDAGERYADGVTDPAEKIVVVDWYYKRVLPTGRTVLHFAKFAGDVLLYASENDPALAERGWYDHGEYPVVLDVLYPEDGTPGGYGLIAVGRNPQGYIDELDGHILEYANAASRVRYWAKRSLGINEQEFLDPDRRIIEVEGDIDEEKLRQITLSPLDGMLTDVRRMKIDELKETTGNHDAAQGSASGGVTAASAIAALQEAGGKGSRDMIAGSHRAYLQIMGQVIELIRQFYDGVRCFRLAGVEGGYLRYSNEGLRDRLCGVDAAGESLYRRPSFDVEVRVVRRTDSSREEQNRLVLDLFRAGLFDESRREAALKALAGMDMEGIGALRAAVRGDGGAGA